MASPVDESVATVPITCLVLTFCPIFNVDGFQVGISGKILTMLYHHQKRTAYVCSTLYLALENRPRRCPGVGLYIPAVAFAFYIFGYHNKYQNPVLNFLLQPAMVMSPGSPKNRWIALAASGVAFKTSLVVDALL